MIETAAPPLTRQIAHWESALQRLSKLDTLASPDAWRGLEQYLNTSLRRSLDDAITRVRADLTEIDRAQRSGATSKLARALYRFRRRYDRVESVIDFYVDALNSRSTPYMNAMLRTCDRIAEQSMASTLVPLGKTRPPVLVYVDRGLGASILKAGLRLWDGSTDNPVAAIKVTLHNLLRPTSLIHEAGHQVAHILDWNDELARTFDAKLPGPWGRLWASWASEVAADAYAFAHTGYASISAMQDVLDGGEEVVFRFLPGDPHPVSFLRVLLGCAQSSAVYGRGPWDETAAAWRESYPARCTPSPLLPMVEGCIPLLDTIAKLVLETRMRAFGGRALVDWVDPGRVAPHALAALERQAGPALWTSPFWATTESIRIVAIGGYQVAAEPHDARKLLARQEEWMVRSSGFSLN